MSDYESNLHRRKFLSTTTATLGGVGIVVTAMPFVRSMAPSEAAKSAGAAVEVGVSTVSVGELITVEWRGKPIWILHRTREMLELLNNHDHLLADPHSQQPQQPVYAANPTRSLKPAYLVVTGICTHLGCIPVYRPAMAAVDLGPDWPGGFYCPCHGSKFDLAGRVFKNVPAPTNLVVPPHEYLTDTLLRIGE